MTTKKKATKRKRHDVAIRAFLLTAPNGRTLRSIISHLRANNNPDAIDYDLRQMRARHEAKSVGGKWYATNLDDDV